ncbi:MAG: Eco57I restriction-modification methylase domain-containing protein [Chloroflexi bacterium]|nr:Eco57I restriction-modification methylase domain-containing protein [Chloroflexota bacterium]
MTAPEIIQQLVARFEQHYDTYRSGKYNETQLRREFLDPFFEALGWDVFNRQGYAEMYKDVIHEDSLEIEGGNKAPDYAFRIGGARKFFVEAKKPAVNIQDNIHPAYQLRRYAWSAKLPLGILTDFEEFAVYDCRVKPNQSDKASTGRVRMFSFREYAEKWDEIAAVFSREAVLKGSFDQYAEGLKGKKGTAEVDDAFLAEIERWRDLLARNIALRNPSLSARELNYAVQMTIDRIVFLRICEDRGVESDYQLKEISAGGAVYSNLVRLFQRADARYNSGLFHFKDEKGQSSAADSLTLNLKIDDKVLLDILKNLYYPESPYVFREIPSDILGQVYERFLGRVIRLTAGHQAKVEEKPEVRKAGGVYYTPTYIVDYIVQNTVGKLLEGMTPKQAASLRILDPACGSGTFPLGAYQYLLDWHLKWYVEHDLERSLAGRNPVLYQAKDGYRLTTAEKKRILLNNIHGVDIDPQAVEVTKLSLLLKVLEGETQETVGSQLALLQERVLPDLGRNIQCGNSLIGPDYYEGRQLTMGGFVDEDERARVNVFDWKAAFPQVFIQGGFDVVVGNPPYLRIQGLQENYNDQIDYYITKYESAVKRFDLYLLFIERAFKLLREQGKLGFICPHKFVNSDFGSGLRSFLARNSAIEKFISFGNNLVFEQASTYTGLLFLQKSITEGFNYYEFENIPRQNLPSHLLNLSIEDFTLYSREELSEKPWTLTKKQAPSLLQSLSRQPHTLGDVCDEILVGVQSGIDNVHVLKFEEELPNGLLKLFSERAGGSIIVERGLVKPFLRGEDVDRYEVPKHSYYCIYPYRLVNGKTKIFEEAEFQSKFPNGYTYLKEYRRELTDIRERQKTNIKYWYSCHRSRDMNVFESERIITPEISLGCNMTIAPAGLYHNTKVYSIIPSSNYKENKNYWLGLLNSRIMWWFLSTTGYVLRGGYFVFKTNYLNPFPIRTINFNDPAERARHENMVALVTRMMDLHRRNPRTPQEKESLAREIESTDKRIDSLVYELYGLTEEEIKIVEG